MRIISGTLKGKKIELPRDKSTRPLRDLVKESIFNVLEHSNKIQTKIKDAIILDLFSGSGSFGLEAISRGAKKVTFIENYFNAYEVILKNINNLNCQDFSELKNYDCFQFIDGADTKNSKFDIIFIDPPYKEKNINILLDKIIEKKMLDKSGLLIIHRHKKDDIKLSSKISIIDERFYGISKIIFAN